MGKLAESTTVESSGIGAMALRSMVYVQLAQNKGLMRPGTHSNSKSVTSSPTKMTDELARSLSTAQWLNRALTTPEHACLRSIVYELFATAAGAASTEMAESGAASRPGLTPLTRAVSPRVHN